MTVQCPECGQTLTVPQAQPRPSKPSGWLPVSIRFSEPHAQSGPSKPPTPTTPNDVATKEPLPPAWTLESVPKAVASTPPGDMPPVTPAPAPPTDKQCPFCAETIKREARVCRFCGYNLLTGQPQQTSHPKSVSPPTVKAESSVVSGVKLGVGMFIVLPLMIICGIVLLVGFLLGGLMDFVGYVLICVFVFFVVFACVRKRGRGHTHLDGEDKTN